MAVSFKLIGGGILTPGVFAEFDTSKAQQGPSIQNHVALLIGQRLAAGTKPAGQIDLITSSSQARDYYGAGSMLSQMVAAFLAENKINKVYAIALDDNGAGVAATGSIKHTGTPTVAGALSYYIGGRLYQVAVTTSDTGATLATALAAKITADADALVTAVVNGGDTAKVDLTYKHKGLVGNEIDIRQDPNVALPTGLTQILVAFTGGTLNPVLTSVIAAMNETQFHEIAMPYNDTTSLNAIQVEMVDRWGPMRKIDGQVYTAKRVPVVGTFSTFAQGRNNEHETILDLMGISGPHEAAANLAAVAARELQKDPASPIQGVPLRAMGFVSESELRSQGEANQLLGDGVSTIKFLSGVMYIERLRTTRKKNEFNVADSSLADLEPKATLSYIRYDFVTRWVLKFSRHKLANDGTRFGPGQAILTPKIAKAELLAIFRGWEELGLVEGFEQFKRDVIVERSVTDPNRLDLQIPPDLVNQLRVTAAQFAFLL